MPWNSSRNAGVDVAVAPLPHGGIDIDEIVGELRVRGRGGEGGRGTARCEPAGWELAEGLLDEGEALGVYEAGNEEEVVLRLFAGLDDAVALLLGDLEYGNGLDNAVALLLGDLGYESGLRYRPEPRELAIGVVAGLRSRPEPWERAIELDDMTATTCSTTGQEVTRHDEESFGCGWRHFWHACARPAAHGDGQASGPPFANL